MATGLNDAPYTKDILRLAAGQEHDGSIDGGVHVERRSRTCGAGIALDLLCEEGRVAQVAVKVSACAYGQAAATIMTRHAVGRSLQDVCAARDGLRDWLMGEAATAGAWPELDRLAPARTRTGRHGAILLPFQALVEAMETCSDG